MQELIETAIRGVGYALLKAASFGRYRSRRNDGLLLEGAVGFLAIAAVIYVAYLVTQR